MWPPPGMDIPSIIAYEDEIRLCRRWRRCCKTGQRGASGRFDGVLALGGSMGTDLALDLCAALPIVPK